MRYIRAFFQALRLTLKGETIDPARDRYPNLHLWLDEARERLATVYRVADAANLDHAAREKIILKLDGRDWSMELVLSSVKFHLDTEFPSLLQTTMEHNLTTLYALHLDDKYRVTQLAQSDDLPTEIRPVVQKFADHFANIPPSTDP